MTELDKIDKKILNRIQSDFPVTTAISENCHRTESYGRACFKENQTNEVKRNHTAHRR